MVGGNLDNFIQRQRPRFACQLGPLPQERRPRSCRSGVAYTFVNSPEFPREAQNQAIAAMLYLGFLRELPEDLDVSS